MENLCGTPMTMIKAVCKSMWEGAGKSTSDWENKSAPRIWVWHVMTNLHLLASQRKTNITYLPLGNWLSVGLYCWQAGHSTSCSSQVSFGEPMHSLHPCNRATFYIHLSSRYWGGQGQRLPDVLNRSFCPGYWKSPTKWLFWSIPSHLMSILRVHPHTFLVISF